MTSSAEITVPEAALHEPVRMSDGRWMVIRAAQRLFGVGLTLAAIGIWIGPGASWESDLMLFKLILSLTALIAGIGLMQSSAGPAKPQVEIDTIRREVRLVRPVAGGTAQVLQRCAFGDLAGAELKGNHVRLFGTDRSLLAEVTLTSRTVLKSLVSGLRDAGKLA